LAYRLREEIEQVIGLRSVLQYGHNGWLFRGRVNPS